MALIKCKECGKEISDQAKVCPNCGCPVELPAQFTQSQNISYSATAPKAEPSQNNSSSTGKSSGMSILAFVLSIFGCTAIISIVLAIIDLTKKDGRKKGFAIAAVVISGIWLLLAVAGMGGSKNTTKSETATSQTTQETTADVTQDEPSSNESEDTTKTTETTKESAVQESGDKFYLGDTWENKYVSVSFDECGDYTSDNMFIQPEEGKKYIYATFTFENVGTSDTTVAYWDFDCYADGYACDATYGADDAGFSQTLSAGRKITGSVYFEVPDDATEIELEFSPSFWSSKKVVFVYQ